MMGRDSYIRGVILPSLFIFLLAVVMSSKTIFASEESEQSGQIEQSEQIDVETEGKASIDFDIIDVFVPMGDPDNLASRAARIGARVHPEALELKGLKKDRFGLVDWAQIIRDGRIAPKISADPKVKTNRFEDWVILFENVTGFDVLFPHDVHTYWLDCESCHDRLFKAKFRSNPIRMTEIVEGKWCGWCHGKIAFPIEACSRCHVDFSAEE